VWLIGAVVCLLAAPLVKLFAAAGTRQPHNALVVTLTHANQLPLRGW